LFVRFAEKTMGGRNTLAGERNTLAGVCNTLAGGRMDKGGVCFDEDIVEIECKINKKTTKTKIN